MIFRLLKMEIRLTMIVIMAVLLLGGVWIKDFSLRPEQIVLTFTFGLLCQAIWIRFLGLPSSSLWSAAVTCTGLSLLLRSDNLWVHPAAAILALSAKFLIRWNQKHIFNPANLGVILSLLFFPGAWVSPGQWGHELAWALWFLVAGGFLASRAQRLDISAVFIATYLGLIGLRILWLGQRNAVWWHQFENGALLLFTFFMISDPRTSPNRRLTRVLHAISVALFAFVWQFVYFKQNGLLWALFFLSPLVPLWDSILRGKNFEWAIPRSGGETTLSPIPSLR